MPSRPLEGLLVVREASSSTDVAKLGADLAAFGCVGAVIDGADLGRPGFGVARVVGVGDDVLRADGGVVQEEPFELVSVDELHAHLGEGAHIGAEVELDGTCLEWPVIASPGARPYAVGVTQRGDLMLDVDASLDRVRFAEAPVEDRILVSRLDPDDTLPDGDLGEALASAKGFAVLLWQREPCSGFQVLRRGRVVESHVWEPIWTPIEPVGCPADLREDVLELCASIAPREADATEVGRRLGLDDFDVVALRAMLRRPAMEAPALGRLLGLPQVAVEVLEGRIRVEELPGAVVHTPAPMRTVLRESLKASPYDPSWVQAMDRGMRELRPWYLVSSIAFLVLCGWGVSRWLDGDSIVWGVLAALGFVAQAVDLLVRAVLKFRRVGPSS